MAVSYKTLWQEAKQEVEKLRAENERLRTRHGKEMDRVYAYIQSHRSNLAETRPIVDLAGIARHMRVARFTPQQWAQRGHLPPVDFPEISEPLWYVTTILDQFVTPTGRVWYDTPDDGDGLSPAA